MTTFIKKRSAYHINATYLTYYIALNAFSALTVCKGWKMLFVQVNEFLIMI